MTKTYRKTYSFLHVTKTGKRYTLAYGGNMGATVDRDVRECFDALYGKRAFALVTPFLKNVTGSADYMWSATVKAKHFEKLFPL